MGLAFPQIGPFCKLRELLMFYKLNYNQKKEPFGVTSEHVNQ